MCHWLSGERDISCPSTLVLVGKQHNSHRSYCLVFGPHNLTEVLLQEAAEGDALRCSEHERMIKGNSFGSQCEQQGNWSPLRLPGHCSCILDSPRGWEWGCSEGFDVFCGGLWLSEAALSEEHCSRIQKYWFWIRNIHHNEVWAIGI